MLLEMGHQMHGWALAAEGAVEEGVAELRAGFERWGGAVGEPWFRAVLIEGLMNAGDDEGAHAVVTGALKLLATTETRMWDAELHRLQGESLAQRGEAKAAVEASFRRALEIARRQGARSLELRAATSLGRLLQRRRETREAQRILEEVCDRFTEGFETRDLQDARALLDSLG